jgi:hypothetical protein
MLAALRPRSGTTLTRAFLLDSVAEHDAIMGATRSVVIVAIVSADALLPTQAPPTQRCLAERTPRN